MAGTEYFSETAQPRDHMPVNTMRKSLIRLSTTTHNLLTFDTTKYHRITRKNSADTHLWTFSYTRLIQVPGCRVTRSADQRIA